jgi:hypothetical protein
VTTTGIKNAKRNPNEEINIYSTPQRGPLNLVSTIEELLERKSSGSDLENRDYGLGIPCADHATPLYPQKLAPTSPTSDSRLVGIVTSRNQATEFVCLFRSTTLLFYLRGNNHKCALDSYRLCGLVVRVLDYRSRDPRLDSRALQKK